jgi:hypothetical protein
MRQFHNKTFQHQGSRYRIRCCAETGLPYYRRLLELEYLEPGVQLDTDEVQTRIERAGAAAITSTCLLWLDPQLIELDDDQVLYLFDFGPGKARLGSDMTGALFLPPVRSVGHPDLMPVLRAEDLTDAGAGSYFSPELAGIRRAIFDRVIDCTWRPGDVEEPAAVTVGRLVDDPLLRDVFLDGGAIRVNSAEGQPTTLTLQVHAAKQPGGAYRACAILDPDGVDGPEWGRIALRGIRDDVYGLVNGGWEIVPAESSSGPLAWKLQPLRPYRPGGHDGTWGQIQRLHENLQLRPDWRDIFEHRVLLPTRERAGIESPPDNDLAELLFMHDAWRCPWTDDLEEPAWRHAMLEFLRDGFRAASLAPEERIASWNESYMRHSDVQSFKFVYSRRLSDSAVLLRYSGSPNDARVLTWRLLLPLGTVVNARTMLLDRAERSQLDRGFVLA